MGGKQVAKFARALVLGVLMIAPATMASATVNTTGDEFTFSDQLTELHYNFSLDGFDSNLGTLLSVQIYYDFSIDSSGTVTNNTSGAADFEISEKSTATLGFSNAYTGSGTLKPETDDVDFDDLAVGATGIFNPGVADIDHTITLSGATLSQFLQDKNLGVTFNTVTKTTQSAVGGNADTSITTHGSGVVRVTYTYDAIEAPVPEPASWALMLGGFGMLGATMRRRKAGVTFA